MNLARLRKAAAEGKDTGTPEQRDVVIEAFLYELSGVVGELVSEKLSDPELRALYVKWVGALGGPSTQSERAEWLASSVLIYPQEYKAATKDTSSSNVVSIARR